MADLPGASGAVSYTHLAAGLVSAISPLSALAAVVSEETPDASVQQQVTLEKTAEVVPTYTVDVPAQVEIGKDAKNPVSYTHLR